MSARLPEHPSPWTLRRLHAGELPPSESARLRAHAQGCEPCGAVLREAEANQRRFEAAVPFARFEARVERALAGGAQRKPAALPSLRWAGPLAAMAAGVLLFVGIRPWLVSTPSGTRIKGGASAELRIGGEGAQRTVQGPAIEPLAPGERVRLGYTPDTHRYVLAVSVDAAGEVTPLYPEAGQSLPVERGSGTHWLPDSLEFTGAGVERVVLILSDEPLAVQDVTTAARRAFQAGGRTVEAMPLLDLPGAQTHWMLLKP
ncbi:DUF4384 domain-containing protein [Stigmatella aurantiaca]|uniref:ActD, putative n=1 Tax=Stigmatella aurantiaca (strain DW4/3-1) TaxID=378806 RepID=Q08XS7_STIAD|nr:DUF4384 domain-containing protein [Stigmatella aurantiaca]ADO73439.1 conserved uncharacterized protein [Stigmatella aurantiaca DW4/3-1]EAU65286.1 ActD, putative [Stigmatella aurantiaca DW4/3-1]